MTDILAAHVGSNADLVAAASSLYVDDGDVVADVTWGKGAFWKKINPSRFTLLKSDIRPGRAKGVKRMDFRHLHYKDASVDVVVLDPPYAHNPGRPIFDERYKNSATTRGMYHDDILRMYIAGMVEAKRVLRGGGFLWVKCKDEVEASAQRWGHVEIYEAAAAMDFYAQDLFVLLATSRTPHSRWRSQHHARKNHSYLWVFKLAEPKKMRAGRPQRP